MTFLRNSLDDPSPQPCGRCANCLGRPVIGTTVAASLAHQAAVFLKHAEAPIKPKKQAAANAFPSYGLTGNLPEDLQAQEGRVLSRWGDAGWGWMVAEDKHGGRFRDDLVSAVAEMISERWAIADRPTWVTCVPSINHPDLVPDFSRRLAAQLGLPFIDAVYKVRENEQQKFQQNRFWQCRNLDGVFATQSVQSGPVLLVDDIVDSGWTLAVIAALLQNSGSGKVYPVTLASTSTGDS